MIEKELQSFNTFTKIGDKNYKVIVDSEKCINAISVVPRLQSPISYFDDNKTYVLI